MRRRVLTKCLIVSKGALVRLTYVASGSVVKRSLST
ncbi:hypothetical protein T07_2826 [Trichinella nelsoni]|uniref:Uncharacterized protein n=1 Tax=Trichinella nelsoni TaxID=6336 RepID=A0A0V0RRV8_9BILA|nr:hypothetical protein T07_2826 [Trichinella nelsoni]